VLVKSDLEVCLLEALIAAVAKWLATISRGLSSKELELKEIAGALLAELGGFGKFRQVRFAKLLQIGKTGRHDECWLLKSATMRQGECQVYRTVGRS